MQNLSLNDGLIIDFFAGGGGASTGIEMALGKSPDIAVNHDPEAIRIHKVNHPNTLHLTEDIFKVKLRDHVKGRHVALLWASPDCTSHSRAKGSKPIEKGLRILPWAVYKHAKYLLPDVIIMENVAEIQKWGPLDENNHPIKEQEGTSYQKFIQSMMNLGYDFESRELVAADFGAPTTRKRWYAVFRRDGKPITWPTPTHNKYGTDGLQKWKPIWPYLKLNELGTSIFGRKKPLAEKTMNRIARGLRKYVFENPTPFIVQVNHGGNNFRGQSVYEPLPTITQKHGFGVVSPVCTDTELILPHISKFYKSGTGQDLQEPIHTITTSPGHFGVVNIHAVPTEQLKTKLDGQNSEEVIRKCTWVSQYLMEYYGCGTGQNLTDPIHTIVSKDRFALISVLGNQYVILDICLRMLSPEELKLGQGFPKDFILDHDINWKKCTIQNQVARIGNSVVPIMAQQLVESNCSYLKVGERVPNLLVDDSEPQLKFA